MSERYTDEGYRNLENLIVSFIEWHWNQKDQGPLLHEIMKACDTSPHRMRKALSNLEFQGRIKWNHGSHRAIKLSKKERLTRGT